MENKLNLLSDSTLDKSSKIAIVKTIKGEWHELSGNIRTQLSKTILYFLNNELFDVCDQFVENVVGNYDPISNDNWCQTVSNLASDSSISLYKYVFVRDLVLIKQIFSKCIVFFCFSFVAMDKHAC